MLLNSWSIALSVISIAVLFVTLVAAITAIRVICYWDISSDSARQIRLENEIWLSSTLMEYALSFQILSLLLLVLAADSFAGLLVGAMCATGSFLANDFGIPALIVKLVSLFFYGFWIVIHRLDISSYKYPLVRLKYFYLLGLCPLLATDVTLQTLYLARLEPDIITSCCGVVFRETDASSLSFSKAMSGFFTTLLFYCVGGGLSVLTLSLVSKRFSISKKIRKSAISLLATGHILFYPYGLWIITNFVSPYVYDMPHHRCPFCLIEKEYFFVGYPLFICLSLGAFLGLSGSLVELFRKNAELKERINNFQNISYKLSIAFLLSFIALCSFYPIMYFIRGGEI